MYSKKLYLLLGEKCAEFSEVLWNEIVDGYLKISEEKEWRKSLDSFPKLRTFSKLKHVYGVEDYLLVDSSVRSKVLCSGLRNGSCKLRIEKGRYKRETVEDRKCICCSLQKVEDEKHFLTECSDYSVEFEVYKRQVVEQLQKVDSEIISDRFDRDEWTRIILCDHSVLSSVKGYSGRGESKQVSTNIHELSLRYIECIDAKRDAKIEMLDQVEEESKTLVCKYETLGCKYDNEQCKIITDMFSRYGLKWSKPV